MPYYRKRKKSSHETWMFMAFGVLVSVLGLVLALSLLSLGLLGLGVLLAKVFPALTIFQATLVPLILLVFAGLYVTIILSTVDLKEALSQSPADARGLETSDKPEVPEGWRYRRPEAARVDL